MVINLGARIIPRKSVPGRGGESEGIRNQERSLKRAWKTGEGNQIGNVNAETKRV